MARAFTSKEAKKLIDKYSKILTELNETIKLEELYRDKIDKSSKALIAKEVMSVLENIPVTEFSKYKEGIKVKTLQRKGYLTIADIVRASNKDLESLKYFGTDSVKVIRNISDKIINQVSENINLRISTDNKTKEYTDLVRNVSIYHKLQPIIKRCEEIFAEYNDEIEESIKYLKTGSNSVRWLFSFSKDKEKAVEAYNYLNELEGKGYSSFLEKVFTKVDSIKRMSKEYAWSDFQKNSVSFFNIIEDYALDLLAYGKKQKYQKENKTITEDNAIEENNNLFEEPRYKTIYGLPEYLAEEVQKESFKLDGLKCELRRYQEWGVKYILHQERVLLGDEMGLGKTVQAIATMVALKNSEEATHFLVVCPASVLTNWCREIENKSDLKVVKIYGDTREVALNAWIKNGGVGVTTYETTKIFKGINNYYCSLLVVDEAHYIKNQNAQRTQNTLEIKKHSDRLLFMTGTALENKVNEMISLIKILQPDIAMNIKEMESLVNAPKFRYEVAPVYYRRKRNDVLAELPEKVEKKVWCSLLPEEERVYEKTILERQFMGARRVSWNVDDLNNSSKAKILKELVEEAERDGRKVIVFSFFLDTISKIKDFLGDRCTEQINGSVSSQRRQEIIDEFELVDSKTVLPAQIQSGGTGLNIQAASVVVICEPQIKPSIENQAISRAYRMGQTRNVFVYRLLCENTIDEKITNLLETKQEIFDAFADKSEASNITDKLDNGMINNIMEAEIDRINEKNKVERV